MYSFAIFFNTSSNQSEKNYFLQTSLTDALIYLPWLSLEDAVFSLNFSSAGKGPFMAGKAKNAPEAHFPGGNVGGGGGGGGGGGEGGEWSEGHVPALAEKFKS